MKTVTLEDTRTAIAQKAMELGFDDVGFCSAAPFEEWLEHAYNPLTKRMAHDPRVLLSDAQCIVVVVKRYAVFGPWPEGSATVANYYTNSNIGFAEIRKLGSFLSEQGYNTVVSPSLPAKQAAVRAGLGVQGMNTQFCHNDFGTLVSLHMVLINAPLAEGDAPYTTCAACGLCAAACPGDAIFEDSFDHQRCIRFHMANGSVTPRWAREKMGLRLIGCTDCQHSCPKAKLDVVDVPAELAWACGIEGLLLGDPQQMETLGRYIGKNFAHPKRIRQQAAIVAGNTGDRRYVPLLAPLLGQDDAVLRTHAAWSLGKLGGEDAQAALADALERELDPDVRLEMEEALESLCQAVH